MNRLVLFLAGSLVLHGLAACNWRYCAGNPDDDCRKSWDANTGPELCKGNSDCRAPTGVCDLQATMMCVQCTTSQAAACSGVTPVCDLEVMMCVQCTTSQAGACSGATPLCISNQCQKCTAHAQCSASNVCLPDGSCADAEQVAYVAMSGSGSACTKTSPCGTLDAGLKKHKPFVKFASGTVADTSATTIDGQAVTIFADQGARLSRTSAGVILQVQNDGADVQIFDLEIAGATGLGNAAIAVSNPNGGTPKLALTRVTVDGNQGLGVSATAGTLTLSRSIVSGNDSGGISVSGPSSIFDISESFIIHNGRATNQPSVVGGAALATVAAGSRFEWNTVAFNESDGSLFRGGVSCTVALATATGNLIYHNTEPDGSGGIKTDATTQNNSAGCQYGNTIAIATDPGNLGFRSPLVMPFDFRLTSMSPRTVIDAGGLCSGQDFDGQSRPIGAACDLGADEYQPAP